MPQLKCLLSLPKASEDGWINQMDMIMHWCHPPLSHMDSIFPNRKLFSRTVQSINSVMETCIHITDILVLKCYFCGNPGFRFCDGRRGFFLRRDTYVFNSIAPQIYIGWCSGGLNESYSLGCCEIEYWLKMKHSYVLIEMSMWSRVALYYYLYIKAHYIYTLSLEGLWLLWKHDRQWRSQWGSVWIDTNMCGILVVISG